MGILPMSETHMPRGHVPTMRNLNLLVLRCGDLERSRSFYECFGMEFQKHTHGGPEHYSHEDEAGVVELYPATKELGDLTGIGFSSPSLELTSAALAAQGFVPEPIRQNPWGMTFIVRDPDGRRVEVKQS